MLLAGLAWVLLIAAVSAQTCRDNSPVPSRCLLPVGGARLSGNYSACRAVNNPVEVDTYPRVDAAPTNRTPGYIQCECPSEDCWTAWQTYQCSKSCALCGGDLYAATPLGAPCRSVCEGVRTACGEYNQKVRAVCRFEVPTDCAPSNYGCNRVPALATVPFTCAASVLHMFLF